MVASSAEDAMRSREEKSSPWMTEKVQSSDEAPQPTPTPETEEADEVAEAAAAAAAAPAPDVGTDDVPCPRTSDVWTERTSRMLEIGTEKIEKKEKRQFQIKWII